MMNDRPEGQPVARLAEQQATTAAYGGSVDARPDA
jgi:hypothetical protein